MLRRFCSPLNSDSFFLFGARGTGKSTFIEEQFLVDQSSIRIDLLDADQEERFSRDPSMLERQLAALPKAPEWIFIDEIQKVPKLLDQVHRLIERQKQKFVLSGSSARKLKRQGANLLAGRAFVNRLFPLTRAELGDSWNLDRALNWGSLPKTWTSSDDLIRLAYLKSYAQTYLTEEIRVEQLVRDLDPFRAFLEVAAQMNGKVLSYSKIAREVGASDKSVRAYFQILEDTLLGFQLPGFHRSIRKSQAQHGKFYWFDLGVKRQLERSIGSPLVPSTSAYGDAFEHLVILEIVRRAEYAGKNWSFSFFQTKEGNEIDLVISPNRREEILVEIKSTRRVDVAEARFLAKLSKDFRARHTYLLSLDPIVQRIQNVECLFWEHGVEKILSDAG